MKTSVTFYPNELKKSPRNSRIPIYLRICMRGKKSETRLNAEISEDQLLKWNPMTMRVAEKNYQINQRLKRIDQKFHEFITLNATQLQKYDTVYIKAYVLGNDQPHQKSVLKFVEEYYTNSVLNSVSRTAGTIINYRRLVNHLNNFLKQRKQENLTTRRLK